jgi:selenocysteine lyase/cysteine desulfurase
MRQSVGRFVDADERYHEVIFVKSTTEALNRVAHLARASETLVFSNVMEHHANLLPWRLLGSGIRYVHVDADGVLDQDDLRRQLRSAPIDVPRLVAISGASNVTGYAPPIHEIARLAHLYGARILVDGAQLVPHRPVSMRGGEPESVIDFLAFSSHKLYAPFGTGVLVVPRVALGCTPDLLGGGIVELVTHDRVVWSDLPDREEAGSPNVVGAVALGAAMQRLSELGMARVANHERALTAYAIDRLSTIPGLRILGPSTSSDRVGIISFTLDSVSHMLAASVLSYEWAIGVRAGCFCAHLGMLHLLRVGTRPLAAYERQILAHDKVGLPGAVRASVGLYNTTRDVDELFDGLGAVVAGHHAACYRADPATGHYVPGGWMPNFDRSFAL